MRRVKRDDDMPPSILLKMLAIFLIPIAAIIYWSASKQPSGKELILQEAKAEILHGRADSIYYQTWNHNIKTIRASDGHTLELWPEWESLIDVGDSLFKRKGDLQVKVFKRSGKVVILDYKEIVKTLKD